jgi:hypothetical protein
MNLVLSVFQNDLHWYLWYDLSFPCQVEQITSAPSPVCFGDCFRHAIKISFKYQYHTRILKSLLDKSGICLSAMGDPRQAMQMDAF